MKAVGVLALMIFGLLLGAGAPASASTVSASTATGTTIGPMQINPVGHPHLCWQAFGNGAPIQLETCDSAVQNQMWSLNPNGVLMNGIGYCLEALPGQPHGTSLYIDFADQCGGTNGQVWTYSRTGQLSSPGTGTATCAGLNGPASAGTDVVRASCGHGPRWSLGYSAVTLAAGTGSGAVGGSYSASVTVANATSAQSAYGVSVAFGLPRGLAAAGLQPAGAASGFRCDVHTATCTGTLGAGASGRIDISGRLPSSAAAGDSYPLTARTTVADTSQRSSRARLTASVNVLVGAAVPAPATGGVILPLSMPLLILIVVILLLGGGLLVAFAARRRSARRPARSEHSPYENRPYPGRSPVELLPRAEQPLYEEQRPDAGQASFQQHVPYPQQGSNVEHTPSVEHTPYGQRRPYDEVPLQVERRPYDEVPLPVERRPYDEVPLQAARRRYDEVALPAEPRPYDEVPLPAERRPYDEVPFQMGRPYDESQAQAERRPYEGRRRRTGPEPAAEPEDLPRPRHHSHR